MKISISRLKQLVPNSLSTEQIADALTMAGLEVEEVSPVAPAFSGIKIAEVVSVDAHPDAAKLRVCQVNAGQGEPLQIVCGAPNVAAGMKVPCALVGAKLPGLDIKAAKLRGVESFGMLCSARELGLSDDHGGLLGLPADAPIGADIRAWMDLDDEILTLKITPNRGDCLSMIGIARDFAAVTGLPLIPSKIDDVAPTGSDTREISIEAPEACGQYFGRAITGLNPNEQSPAWLKRRLERAGLRPISPLVDITNLVMIELGQPMHAFDLDKLNGGISVRFASAGESLRLLTGIDAQIDESMLLICDESGPVAAGGVMGGESTMCTDTTTSVLFEAAWFAPDVIRGKSKALGINSDAAYRFERGVDPSCAKHALEWATALTREICGTDVTRIGPVCSAMGRLPARNPVAVRPRRAERLIGMPIATEVQIDALKRVGCAVDMAGEVLKATAPSHRFDLSIEEDFVEEIARIHGYARIPDRAPVSTLPMLQIPSSQGSKPALKNALARMGYHEAINYSFVDPAWEADFCGHSNAPRLQNPIASQMAVMRSSLIGGLVSALKHNLDQGESRIKMFEIGRCFMSREADERAQPERLGLIAYGPRYPEQWGEGGQKGAWTDYYVLKGESEQLLGSGGAVFERTSHPALHPGRSATVKIGCRPAGVVGELHPKWVQKYGLKRAPIIAELDLWAVLEQEIHRFVPFSRMQSLRRDVALCLDEKVEMEALRATVQSMNSHEIREFEPFDIYRGTGLPAGQKSVAFRVVMQDTERTLTDSDADSTMAEIVKVLGEKFGATLRK